MVLELKRQLGAKLMQTLLYGELGAATGGFHDGQLKPKSSGRPGGTSEDEADESLSSHSEGTDYLKALNFQGGLSGVHHD